MNDSEIIGKILSHDRRALHTFYHTYTPKLRRYLASRVHSEADSEEILQDTLYGFLEAIRDFQGKSSIKTFLYSICNHKLIDYYRRKKLKHIVFSQMPQLEALISPLVEPEEALDATILTEKIHRALAGLIPRYRAILVFKYMEDLSVETIAEKLKVSFKSAESLLFRARRAFVKAYIVL